MKILLLEDAVSYADSLAAYLRSEGHEVLQAYNYHQSKLFLKEHLDADLAIVDYSMPVHNGDLFIKEFLRYKQRHEITKKTIILGNSGDHSYNAELMKAGADDYLVKGTGLEILERHKEIKGDLNESTKCINSSTNGVSSDTERLG